MRNQPETLHAYNIPRLHWWFLLSSLAFVGCFVLMIWVDYSGGKISWLGLTGDRTWKIYQHEFYDLEKQRLTADAKASEIRASEAGLGKLEEQKTAAEKELAAKHEELNRLRGEAEKLRIEEARITREFTMEKAMRDQVRSFYEAALERHELDEENPEVREWKRKVTDQNRKVADLELEKQQSDAKYTAAQAKVETLVGHEEELGRTIKRLGAGTALLNKRLTELNSFLVQAVVNAPIAEFATPTYKVEQIIAENHHVSVNFATVPRVDRCITCHKAMDRKDPTPEDATFREKHKIDVIKWSELPQPLKNHPRLDLYVSDTSPHPMSKYGCTTCHWGWDRETQFSRAGHTPDAEEKVPHAFDEKKKLWERASEDEDEAKVQTVKLTQREAWEKNYDWYHEHYNEQPMRRQKYVQASCLKCHTEQTHIKGGESLDHGRRLIEQLGCWSCHKMKQLESYNIHYVAAGETFDSICKFYDVNPDEVRRLNNLMEDTTLTVGRELQVPIRTLRKSGPSLYKVAGKVNKEWARKWLADPVAFRPNTYMPRFWGLDNNKDTPDRNAVEINAVTEYLFTVSEKAQYPKPPVTGDVERGKTLAEQTGCLACHVVNDNLMSLKPPAKLAKYMDEWEYRRYRSQGYQLAGTGSKTSVNWLYAWLKNPKQYHPQTKMPNLRLNDQEAADIATYLASLHNEKTDKESLPALDENVLNAVTLEYLQVTLPLKQAEEKLNNLDSLIEQFFVDESTMRYYTDPTRLAREESRLKDLQKQYEESFDDAIQAQATTLEAKIKDVKVKLVTAKQAVAGLDAGTKKNIFLGQKIIARNGCFACHNIHGFESAKPIGTELSEWGSKPLGKLDFGLVEVEHDRVAWLKQKLHAPRSYDTGRIGVTRSPQELLKMPKFNLTEEQIDQIVTVISGLTDEKLLANEPRRLTPAEFQMERGRWIAKELNCTGCHQLEGQGWAIRATGIPAGMEPPMLSGLPGQLRQGQRTNPDWLFNFLKAPQTGQIRPWLKARMPTFDLSDAEANVLVRYFALEGQSQFPYVEKRPTPTAETLAAGKQLFEKVKCGLCHIVEGKALGKPLAEIPEEDLPRLAPNLSLAHVRLQRDWIVNHWLPNPGAQVPGTKMPQFSFGAALPPDVKGLLGGDEKKQAEALVDYVLSLGANEGLNADQAASVQSSSSEEK